MAPAESNWEEILSAAVSGDASARDRFIEEVYDQLHRVASKILNEERRGLTLQTTALVNEAYLHIFGGKSVNAVDQRHFLNIAARQMRRILIDRARAFHTAKRSAVKISLEGAGEFSLDRSAEMVALDDALNALAAVDSAAALVVEQKFFGGYTDEETAQILEVNIARVRRDWAYARAWLHDYLSDSASH